MLPADIQLMHGNVQADHHLIVHLFARILLDLVKLAAVQYFGLTEGGNVDGLLIQLIVHDNEALLWSCPWVVLLLYARAREHGVLWQVAARFSLQLWLDLVHGN